MLSSLQELFQKFASPEPAATGQDHEHALHLAAAVLLVEVMRAEPDITGAERSALADALRRRFALGEDELSRLVADADMQARKANDFFLFTNRLNQAFGQPEKIALVEAMWQVAYADSELDAAEIHVISKVAGLLHVTHGQYIAAKMRAKEAAGLL